MYAAYGILNIVCLSYAISIFIGIRAGFEDLGASLAVWKTVVDDRSRFSLAATVIRVEPPTDSAREITEPVAAEAIR